MEEYKIIKVLKGGSFSSTNVIEDVKGNKRVRKFISQTQDREYGLVRWQSQIRRMQLMQKILPSNSPAIIEMGTTDDSFYYDIRYYDNSLNLYEYLHTHESNKVFSKVNDLIRTYSDMPFGVVKGSFSVFFTEEVIHKLELSADAVLKKYQQNIFSEDEYEYALSKIDEGKKISLKLMEILKKIKIKECFTHGNLTLENMIYDRESDNIILIDPYSETYCESILGDYSQLMQSSISYYEYINNKGESFIKDIRSLDIGLIPNGLKSFGDLLIKKLNSLEHEDALILSLFHAAQFIRMFPFKIDKTPRLAVYFLIHGINLILDTQKDA